MTKLRCLLLFGVVVFLSACGSAGPGGAGESSSACPESEVSFTVETTSMVPLYRVGQVVDMCVPAPDILIEVETLAVVESKATPGLEPAFNVLSRVAATEGSVVRLRGGRLEVDGVVWARRGEVAPCFEPCGGSCLVEEAGCVVGEGEYFLLGDAEFGTTDSVLSGVFERSEIKLISSDG